MKRLLVKLQFKLASWLYNQDIIAPQLLEHKTIRVMNDEEMEDRQKALNFWNSLSQDMKLEYLTYMKKYGEYDVTPENITDEQITKLWIYAV
jgi:hypothetical protein|tara:strand:- start:120 stop:395 length:276 start_codon:yes stop_codon:yes gene_type:complete